MSLSYVCLWSHISADSTGRVSYMVWGRIKSIKSTTYSIWCEPFDNITGDIMLIHVQSEFCLFNRSVSLYHV